MGSTGNSSLFQRKGEVKATRLTEQLRWRTERGDELHGETGDWLVTGPGGVRRTVSGEEFAHSYELIEGDRYARVGVFRARQVAEHESVQTLEGAATAEPGDWVVTGPNGNSWPVPDQVFRAGYEPAGQASATTDVNN